MRLTRHTLTPLITVLCALLLAGCQSTSVRSTSVDPIVKASQPIAENELLDVGIEIFDPGIDGLDPDAAIVSPAIREAESRYIPVVLADTLQRAEQWGAVRVIPDRASEMDVWVDGRIVNSDGEILELEVHVEDVSGRTWFHRRYQETASKYNYDRTINRQQDAFQNLYVRVANDMAAYMRAMTSEERLALRTISELKFAERFAPGVYTDYLQTNRDGELELVRLPAENDPILERIRSVRNRDNLFVDTVQDYYDSFALQMEEPYREWRTQSYRETIALREQKGEAIKRGLLGAAMVIGGILAQSSDNRSVRTAGGVVGIGGGAYAIKSGLDKSVEAQMHAEALREISYSLEGEVEPHTVALEGRTITLTGTVQEQYAQWRSILAQIYTAETGKALPQSAQ